MLRWAIERWATPRVSDRLLRHLDETLVAEIRHHWIVFLKPALIAILGLASLIGVGFVPSGVGTVLLVLAIGLLGWAAYQALEEHMDRFVVTNMRAFRVRGVLGQSSATMPLSRVLDITVHKTLLGRMLGYGHFVFESAAQEQGLREIRFVPGPDRIDLVIQEQVQSAGLRGRPRSEQPH